MFSHELQPLTSRAEAFYFPCSLLISSASTMLNRGVEVRLTDRWNARWGRYGDPREPEEGDRAVTATGVTQQTASQKSEVFPFQYI